MGPSNKKAEMTWSLFHPVELDVDYMAEVLEKAKDYDVDSFEICGQCHNPFGGLDGLILYEKYPEVNAILDKARIEDNRKTLKKILSMAHAAGKSLVYWHREVMVPAGVIKAVPGMIDANGEFDLLGNDFENLLRYKLESAFEAVAELDGIVLTLTEADYSVIHNSTPDKYPPAKVVEKIVRIFASELQKRGKRFVLRSFGSIAQDYKDILDGAELAAEDFSFEVETKITPYDFVPFLPLNPFFREIKNVNNSGEFDSMGEFLSAGYLPAANVTNIVRYVNEAVEKGLSRYAIRLDRIGNSIFKTHEINLYAYHRAAKEPGVSPEQIWTEWGKLRWNGCAAEMIELSKAGFELVKRVHYIDGNVIFHAFPLDGSMKWLKAAGIFALFKNGANLNNLSGIWSILSQNNTPGRDKIRKEKAEAVEIAEKGLKKINELKSRLSIEEFSMAERAWSNAVVASRAVKAFIDAVCSYFDDMEANLAACPSLMKNIASAKAVFAEVRRNKADSGIKKKESSDAIEHHVFMIVKDLDLVYTNPLENLCNELLNEYKAEFAARKEFAGRAEVADYVICGGITDEGRIGRYMHASHSFLKDGVPCRIVANRIFPNGFIESTMKNIENGSGFLKVKGNPAASPGFKITVNGSSSACTYDKDGTASIRINSSLGKTLSVKIEKTGSSYPEINAIWVEK